MATKQITNSLMAPDGSQYVTLTDGAGNLINGTTGSGGSTVSGDVAAASADSGNPVKVGGVFNTSPSTVSTGQRTNIQTDNAGYLYAKVTGDDGAGGRNLVRSTNYGSADAQSAAMQSLIVGTYPALYNGASWDRQRSLQTGSQTSSTGIPQTVLTPNVSALAGIASTATTAAAGSLILKASAGNLFSVCVNAGASAGYLMVFDSATVPADGAVTPVFSIPVAANGFYTTDWAYPIRGTTGLTLVFSTTGPFTKTISATAFLSGQFI